MGLAYKLDVELWSGIGDYISYGMIELANKDPDQLVFAESADMFGGIDWCRRFCGTAALGTDDSQAIYPTGEYIIRDIAFINGHYILVGSYKAYFRDLYGAGNHGYAWDGFIMPLRGYTYGLVDTSPFLYNKDTKAYIGLNSELGFCGWGFMPMRMPIDITPGVIGDAALVAADSSVGLQAVDIYKNDYEIEVGGRAAEDSANIKIITVGFQLVGDPVAQGMVYEDIDYIGFMWNTQLLSYIDITSSPPQEAPIVEFSSPKYAGGLFADYITIPPLPKLTGNVIQYWVTRQSTMQTSWRATSNYTCPQFLPLPGAQTRLHDLDKCCAISNAQSGGPVYEYSDMWAKGWAANGDSWVGQPPLGQDASTTAFNYYPRRFLDICTYSKVQKSGFGSYEIQSPFSITGDISVGGDPTAGTPTLLGTYPVVVGGAYPSQFLMVNAIGAPANDKLNYGPYLVAHTSGVSFVSTGNNLWTFVGNYSTAPLLDLKGAYGVFFQTPYEDQSASFTGLSPSGLPPLEYIALNDVTDAAGGRGCAIFATNEPAQNPEMAFYSVLAPNQNPLPTTYGYPSVTGNKWYQKAMQSRTFTTFEEDRAKVVNYFDSTDSEFGTNKPQYVINANNGEKVGVFGNYQRYGLDVYDYESETPTSEKQMGSNSRQGYGLLGWQSGTGPITYMFDSGRGWQKNPLSGPPNFANPPEYSNVVLNVGNRFNDAIIVNPSDTDRKAIMAQWDNDRDQWIFIFSEPTSGLSAVSVTSTFTDSPFGEAYLDQTPNFLAKSPLVDDYLTGAWSPFLMTNELDGIVFMGGDDLTNSGTSGIFGYTGDGRNLCPSSWVYAVTAGATTQTPPNDWGSTTPIGTIEANYSTMLIFLIQGTTGRTAKVWVDYILFDGADAVIATKLRERGMKVTIEAVEWFKRKIINSGDLNIKQEEIEMWMREQQDEFQMMMRDAERMGRVRKKKKQVSAYGLDMLDSMNTDFEDKEVQEFMKEYLPQSRPPTPEEQMIERQQKGGYSPESKNYYDEVFEN